MPRPYQIPGLILRQGVQNDPEMVRALQQDLRALGYLRQGIDGAFGAGTEQAIRSLQFDLMNNTGQSTGSDGPAPVSIASFNAPPVPNAPPAATGLTGALDQNLAAGLDRLLSNASVVIVPTAPSADANAAVLAAITATRNTIAPTPFVLAITNQESANRLFQVPTATSSDNFLTVGLDFNDNENPSHITSRGYGIGQITLFHHPARQDEMDRLVADPVSGVAAVFTALRVKFDGYVTGPNDRADDRTAEHPTLPLRPCKYAPSDPLYLNGCGNCAKAARKIDITPGTPVYHGASLSYQPDVVYKSATYLGIPDRADFLCDWPYAARRYNGSGLNSYHYQCRILSNLLLPAPPPPGS